MIRSIPQRSESVFLTFDDGPDPKGTEAVLQILRKYAARATFFLVAEKAKAQPALVYKIIEQGHTLGNHSLDHRYRHYWRGKRKMMTWIRAADDELSTFGHSVGFRPPAGVITPPLWLAARALNEPIVLWNERFYDAVFPWTIKKARQSAAKLPGGSIVLLHDRQRPENLDSFCTSLDTYLACLTDRGLKFEALTRDLCSQQGGQA